MRKSVLSNGTAEYRLFTHRTLKNSETPNKEIGSVIGLDIGRAGITCVLTDLLINVIQKEKSPLPRGGAGEIARASIDLIKGLMGKAGDTADKIKAIGIGASDETFYPAAGMIEKEFGVETFAGSDAASAAFGEKMLNPDADVEDLLYMHSDIGCGIIIKGDIYFGAGGGAGGIQFSSEHISKEEEHIFLEESRYLRPWGEDLGMIQAAKREVEKGIGTKIVELAGGRVDNITKEIVVASAREHDEVALAIIQNAGRNLGIRIAYLVNLFNPELVVVGGGVEKAGELLLEPIKKAVSKLSFTKSANIVKIIPSALGEDAVSLGAAALAVREIFLKS